MSITSSTRKSNDGQKIYYQFAWGKSAGQRISTGIFTYTKPKNAVEKNHNKEALLILESKRSQMILDRQSVATAYIPAHKIKTNFLDFYGDFLRANARRGSRHLMGSYVQFKKFLKKDYIAPIEVTETLCENYRNALLEKYNGETPANYFREFKRVMKAAKKNGYFRENPAEDIASKQRHNKIRKEVLEPDEYIRLINTPFLNQDVKKAFVFCLYTGLRWSDVKSLKWENIRTDSILLEQSKTKVSVEIPMHPIAELMLGKRKTGLIFKLPTADGANKLLKQWRGSAGVTKHITWHCARLSFSVLLQDSGVNVATVAGMLGHTSTRQVEETYQRYRLHIGRTAIGKLPSAEL